MEDREGRTATSGRAMTERRLAEALDAWNTGDVERVLEYMSEDCAYHASFGPELLGRSYRGREAVRQGVRVLRPLPGRAVRGHRAVRRR